MNIRFKEPKTPAPIQRSPGNQLKLVNDIKFNTPNSPTRPYSKRGRPEHPTTPNSNIPQLDLANNPFLDGTNLECTHSGESRQAPACTSSHARGGGKRARIQPSHSKDGASGSTSLLLKPAQTHNSDMEEASLVREYGIEGAQAEDILGFDDADGESTDSEGSGEDDEEYEDDTIGDNEFNDFKTQTRIDETLRFEKNRREGGRKTQEASVKAWKEWVEIALKSGQIKDEIIDEHHLLLWIKYCAERPKKNRRGQPIPGTFIGASHIKKLYFAVMRLRKLQDAKDPNLKTVRPAVSVIVWDSVKTRMHEALNRSRSGEVPGEDAPDIIKNTFLDSVTDAQLAAVGDGFLMHRHLHSVINGHLAWTAQRASANRGDDFRALKLAELQPHTFMHPNGQTGIECILALQGEEKAGGGRGMKTKVNPVYTAFIAHREPERCPLGAFMLYHHYIHDVKRLTETEDINWSWNNSWRQVRILHGPKSPTTPYNEQNLYNLYIKAFQKADFASGIVVHLPRHLMPAELEELGVSAEATSKMGRWSGNSIYHDHYAPALPKSAILGAHGYKVHEDYNPTWRHVHVPEQFLRLMCPMAEEIHEQLVGRKNLSGAANYWSMIINHRRYGFLSAAAIFQRCPDSALFRLPALANPDVQNWMKNDFPAALTRLRESEGNPVDLARIQNTVLQMALEEMRALLAEQSKVLAAMTIKLERRTEVFSPSKSFSNQVYHERFEKATDASVSRLVEGPASTTVANTWDDTGVYTTEILGVNQADTGLRAFVNESPKQPSTSSRAKSQVDLILPPIAAFSRLDEPQPLWPPILGQRSVLWTQVYPLIQRPELLWDYWGPSKTVNSYDLDGLWESYNDGERVFSGSGVQIGVKPPIRQVELYFQHKWRKGAKERKAWERYREIPEFIELESSTRGVSPRVVLDELENMRQTDVLKPKIGLSALAAIVKKLRKERISGLANEENSLPSVSRKRKVLSTGSETTTVKTQKI